MGHDGNELRSIDFKMSRLQRFSALTECGVRLGIERTIGWLKIKIVLLLGEDFRFRLGLFLGRRAEPRRGVGDGVWFGSCKAVAPIDCQSSFIVSSPESSLNTMNLGVDGVPRRA